MRTKRNKTTRKYRHNETKFFKEIPQNKIKVKQNHTHKIMGNDIPIRTKFIVPKKTNYELDQTVEKQLRGGYYD